MNSSKQTKKIQSFLLPPFFAFFVVVVEFACEGKIWRKKKSRLSKGENYPCVCYPPPTHPPQKSSVARWGGKVAEANGRKKGGNVYQERAKQQLREMPQKCQAQMATLSSKLVCVCERESVKGFFVTERKEGEDKNFFLGGGEGGEEGFKKLLGCSPLLLAGAGQTQIPNFFFCRQKSPLFPRLPTGRLRVTVHLGKK